MRYVFAAALTLSLPAAGQAQEARPHVDPAQAAAALQNPLVQDGVAAMVSQIAGIVLDTRVGPMAALADRGADIHANDTLRDVERRNDPDFEAKLHDRTRGAVATAGAVAGGVAAQSAEMQRTADRLQVALAPLIAMLSSPRN